MEVQFGELDTSSPSFNPWGANLECASRRRRRADTSRPLDTLCALFVSPVPPTCESNISNAFDFATATRMRMRMR